MWLAMGAELNRPSAEVQRGEFGAAPSAVGSVIHVESVIAVALADRPCHVVRTSGDDPVESHAPLEKSFRGCPQLIDSLARQGV